MNFWNDWHDKATGEQTSSERKAKNHDRNQRTEQSREQQNKYNAKGDRQSEDAGHGYDPAAISSRDSWSSWDHKHMKTMVDDIDTGAIHGKGGSWQSVGGKLANSFDQFHSEVTTAVKGGWTGDAATAAATAPDGMAKWGKAMGSASQGTGTRMQQAATAADQARINMPEPKDFSWRRNLVNGAGGALLGGLSGGLVSGGNDAYEQHKEAQQAKQKAVDVMNRMYTEGYVEVDNTTPAFVAPDNGKGKVEPPPGHKPPIIGEWPPPPPPGHRGGGDDTRSDNGGDNGGDGRTNPPNDPGRTDPSQLDPRDNDPNNPPTDTGRTDPNQYDPNGNRTGGGQNQGGGGVDPRNAHNANSGMGGMPMMGGGGGMGGGAGGDSEYGGRGYGGRGGAGGGAGSGASESAGGRSGIGGSAAQEAMGGGRGGGGGRGAGGMGGGRGGKKEEDSEHESPDYLVETDDVFGSGEMVAPPVIGGE